MMNTPRAKRKSGGAPSAAQRHLQRKRISGRRARSVSYAESEDDDDDSEDVAKDSQDVDEDGDGGASLSGDVIEEDDDDGDSEGSSGAVGNRRHGSGRGGLAGKRGGKHHSRGDPLQPPIFFEQGPDFSEEVIDKIDRCNMNSNL